MLPIVDVPIIHEVVKECIEGGITDIILVTSYGNDPLEITLTTTRRWKIFLKEEINR
jgi:UTP-glucose-1-phosphate uridylyltransferase